MSELYDILVETPPTKVILLALDQGLWDCERSLAELAALCEANHMEAVAEVTQKRLNIFYITAGFKQMTCKAVT